MYKSKKTYSLALILALFVVLAPCWAGGSSGSSSSGSSDTSSNWKYVKGGPIAENPVTISFLTHTGHASTSPMPNNDLPVYALIMKRLGITVDWQLLERMTYNETVNIRLMSRDLPDMVVLLDMNIITQMVEDGVFISYDDLNYKDNCPYAQELFSDPDYTPLEKVYRSLYPDKKMYGFGNTVMPRFLYNNILVNNVWLENLGMAEPKTIDEFYNMLVAFRDKDPNKNGQMDEIPLAYTGGNVLDIALGGAFNLNFEYGWERNSSGNIVSIYTTNKYRDYLEFRKRLYDDNLIDKENRNMTANYELVAADRLGAIGYFGTFQRIISEYSPYRGPENSRPIFREIIPLANIYTGNPEIFSRLGTGTGEPMLILTGAKYPEVCLRLSDWLWASSEYDMLRNFGIEGLSYRMENDIPIPMVPEDYTGSAQFIAFIGGTQPPWTNRQSEYAIGMNNPQWVRDRAQEIKPYYIDGLMPAVLTIQDQNEINRYSIDVNTYRSEMAENFITGRRPLNQFDQYVNEINAIGMERLRQIRAKYY